MDAWLSSLKDLLDFRNAVKLTLPGLLSAAMLTLFLWPPKPIDVIPEVTSTKLPIDMLSGSVIGNPVRSVLIPRLDEPGCIVDEYQLKELPGILFIDYKNSARLRQYALEQENENFEKCLAEEKRLEGEKQSHIDALRQDLKARESLRSADAALIAEYEKSDSPMIGMARKHLDSVEREVWNLRAEIWRDEQQARDRDWEVTELSRWKGVVSDRLADPGKLRPELGFDDYMSVLSKHVLAFIFLTVALGTITEAILTPGVLGMLESFLFGP
jgi:hypothetical protein